MDEDQKTSCVAKVSRCLQLGHSVSEISEYSTITASQSTISLSSISNDKNQLTFILGLILSLLTFGSSGGKKTIQCPLFYGIASHRKLPDEGLSLTLKILNLIEELIVTW